MDATAPGPMLPIPGTSLVGHLEENVAAGLHLTDGEVAALTCLKP